MRLPLILALLLAAPFAARAAEAGYVPSGTALPLSGDPGWRLQASGGGGVVMINSAGGQHHITPNLTGQAAYRMSPLLTLRSRLDLAWRREGTDRFFAETAYQWITFRPDGTLGTDRAQFTFGAGPSLILSQTRLHGAGRNVHGNAMRLGFEYGVGLRWMAGRFPMSVDFSGHQRETRHDFRATVCFGIPLMKSRPAAESLSPETAR